LPHPRHRVDLALVPRMLDAPPAPASFARLMAALRTRGVIDDEDRAAGAADWLVPGGFRIARIDEPGDRPREAVDLRLLVRGHRRDPQPRSAPRNGRMTDALRVVAVLEQALADRHRAFVLAEHDGQDMRRARRRGDRVLGEPRAQPLAIRPEPFASPGLFVDQAQRDAGCLDGGGCECTREDEAACGVDEEVAHLRRAGNEGAEGADRFAEGAHQDIDLAEHACRLGGAASACAQAAGAVRIIEQHHRVRVVGPLHDLRHGRDVAVHAVDTVDGDQHASGLRPHAFERLGEGLDVAVTEDRDLGAGEPGAVDDRGVVELVGDQHVAASDESRDHPDVRHVAGVEGQRGLASEERCELGLEGLVAREVARDEPRATRRAAPVAGRPFGGLDDLGVTCQVEIVAAREEQHVATIDTHARGLKPVEHAHAAIGPALVDAGENLVRDGVEWAGLSFARRAHGDRSLRVVRRLRGLRFVASRRAAHARAISGFSSWSPPPGIRNCPDPLAAREARSW